jgi:phosphoglycerate dehydrogenase-like enzyme
LKKEIDVNEWKISSLDVWTPRIQKIVRDSVPDGFAIRFATSYDEAEQRALVEEADFVLTGWAAVSGEMISSAPRLRMIQKWGIGVDRIDLESAEREGIIVAITAGANASVVAEHAIMLMLAVYRRLSLVDRALRDGRWLFADMRERCFQLRGKTVGLVGFGHIGQMMARKLQGFEVSLLYYDPIRPDPERELGAKFAPMERLLAESDLVSLHLPGGAENRHLFGADAFARMKPGAVLINTARGEVVDEQALYEALVSGKLMGAGLDVYEPEPPPANHKLLTLDQVVVTPHTAGSVLDNVQNVARHAFGNMLKVLHGNSLVRADVVVWPEQARSAL